MFNVLLGTTSFVWGSYDSYAISNASGRGSRLSIASAPVNISWKANRCAALHRAFFQTGPVKADTSELYT